MIGRTAGRGGRAKRSTSVTKRKNYDDAQANKAKKSYEGSLASDSTEKGLEQLLEKVSKQNNKDPKINDKHSSPSTKDSLMTDKSETVMNISQSINPYMVTNKPPTTPTAGFKTTGLDKDGYASDGSDTTPRRSSSFQTRISVNFFVPPSENEADKKLFAVASKWMAKILESDNKVHLLPWFDSDMGEDAISTFKDIPTSLFMFKKYFQRANPNEKGGKVYTDLYLAHSKPMKEIQGDLSWWLKKEKIDIFVKEIQAETTSRLGWLLFSFSGLHIKL